MSTVRELPDDEMIEYHAAKVFHPDWSQCLCHCTDNTGNLTSFTDVSWKTFQKVAETRQDDVWRLLSRHWESGLKGYHHRKFYKKYTRPRKAKKVTKVTLSLHLYFVHNMQ